MGAYQQPSEDDIEAFCALLPDVPREEVIARLRNNNCNVDQAVGEYFDDLDNPNGNKYRWDEGQFGGDRDGSGGNHGISFDIQGPDVNGPYSQFDTAPSRPPSRTSNNKSPLGKIIDMTAQAAVADPSTSKTYMGGDRDLEQALAASRAEAGLPPQETGITSTNDVHFGPATRTQYEQGKWEMVPMGKSSAGIMMDPEPAGRKRDIDAPPFLKPSIENHRLGALFTIYHEIPMIREVFLNRIDVIPNYGFDKEWWTGKIIEQPVVVKQEDDETPEREVVREIQRLMAFLDKTDRAYGSVGALAALPDVNKSRRWDSEIESAVLDAWRQALEDNQAVINKLFSRGVPCEEEEDRTKEFAILELLLPSKDSLQETLYDIADEALWPSLGPLDLAQSPYLSHIAEVIAFKIDGDESSKNIDIPAIWYPDRYLKSARQAALDMRLQKHEVEESLRKVYTLENNLTDCPLRGGKTVKVKDLFDAALQHDAAEIPRDDGTLGKTDMGELAPKRPSKTSALSAELRKLAASIDKKLLALSSEKDKAREALKNLSKLYTEPSTGPEATKLHAYSLRGVSTTKNTMYICRRAEPNLIDMDLDDDHMTPHGDQWWRIHYATVGQNPVTVERTTEENVLHAAKNESKNTVLVYASEKAMDFSNKALPNPLDTFVRADNKTFKAEFTDPEESQTQLSSPGKRKFDEQSEASQDSVVGRWPGGGESSASVLERELGGADGSPSDEARAASQNFSTRLTDVPEGGAALQGNDVIEGVDPSLTTNKGQSSAGQEMQERGNMRLSIMGGGRSHGNNSKTNTIDSMDLDEVLEDTRSMAESAAVKQVGYSK